MAITIRPNAGVQMLCATVVRSQSDAAESITLAGTVWGVLYCKDLSTGSVGVPVDSWSQSVSGTITTLTIYLGASATSGKLLIFYTPN